jgi:hypothetical protein
MTTTKPDCTVRGYELSRAIRDVLPFAATSPGNVPQLCGVVLHAGHGGLSATATDRYALAHSRATAAGALPDGGLLLRRSDASLVADAFRGSVARVSVNVTGAGDLSAVRFTGRSLGDTDEDDDTTSEWAGAPVEITVRTMPTAPFVGRYLDLFHSDHRRVAGVEEAIGFRPDQLARYAKVAENRGGEPMRVYTYGSARVGLRVEIGDDFAAMQMPARIDDGHPGRLAPVVPIGHSPEQAQPAAEAA